MSRGNVLRIRMNVHGRGHAERFYVLYDHLGSSAGKDTQSYVLCSHYLEEFVTTRVPSSDTPSPVISEDEGLPAAKGPLQLVDTVTVVARQVADALNDLLPPWWMEHAHTLIKTDVSNRRRAKEERLFIQ